MLPAYLGVNFDGNPNWVLNFDFPKRVLNNARLDIILFQTWHLSQISYEKSFKIFVFLSGYSELGEVLQGSIEHFRVFPEVCVQGRAKFQPELMSIFGKYIPSLCEHVTNFSQTKKKITLSVLRQIKNGLVVLFSFAKKLFLLKG